MTKMLIDRATVEQALEALEFFRDTAICSADTEAASEAIAALRAALAQQADPTDPGHDVDVLREHVRHLERRVRELHAQQAEPVESVATFAAAQVATERERIFAHIRSALGHAEAGYDDVAWGLLAWLVGPNGPGGLPAFGGSARPGG